MQIETQYNLGDEVVFKTKHDKTELRGKIYSISIDVCFDAKEHNRQMYEIMAEDRLFHWCKPHEILGVVEE